MISQANAPSTLELHYKEKQIMETNNQILIAVSDEKERAFKEDEGTTSLPLSIGIKDKTVYLISQRKGFLDLGTIPQSGRTVFYEGYLVLNIGIMLNPYEAYVLQLNPHNSDNMEMIKTFASNERVYVDYPNGVSKELPSGKVAFFFDSHIITNLCRQFLDIWNKEERTPFINDINFELLLKRHSDEETTYSNTVRDGMHEVLLNTVKGNNMLKKTKNFKKRKRQGRR